MFAAGMRLATAVAPVRVQKGAVVRLEGRYVEVFSTKTNPVGTQFEFIEVDDRQVKGKFRVKSYETVDLVDEEFTVEVDRVIEEAGLIRTVTGTHERIDVPIALLTAEDKLPTPGSKLTVLMDEGKFVRIKVRSANSRPKWLA